MLLLPLRTDQLLHRLELLLKRYQRQVSGAISINLNGVMARIEEALLSTTVSFDRFLSV